MSSSLSLGGRTLDAGLPLYLCGRQGTPHGRRGEELNLVYTLSEGKITQLEGYYTSDEALEAAGLAE